MLPCAGAGDYGQLGHGANSGSATPVAAVGTAGFVQVAAGHAHTCARKPSGEVWCWVSCASQAEENAARALVLSALQGNGGHGALGQGTFADANHPVQVVGGHEFIHVTAGGWFSCGITKERDGMCWCAPCWRGQGGLGSSAPPAWLPAASRPSPPPHHPTKPHHQPPTLTHPSTCPRRRGGGYWGSLGNGNLDRSATPVRVLPYTFHDESLVTIVHPVTTIVAGARHACGLTPTGHAHCWGA